MIVDASYKAFYDVRHSPFGFGLDPHFLYLAQSHRTALDLLVRGVNERRPIMVLTGEIGTGKTTVVHVLRHELRERVDVVSVVQPLPVSGLVATVINALGGVPTASRKADLLAELASIVEARRARGQDVLVVVDEAQALTSAVLAELGGLSDLVPLLLVGQPKLDTLLALPELTRLKQRVAVRATLRPLTQIETKLYLEHRLRSVGAPPDFYFPTSVVERIFRHSGGIPRVINHLGHATLLAGSAAKSRRLTPEIVEQGFLELVSFDTEPPRRTPPRPWDTRRITRTAQLTVLAVLTGIIGFALAVVPRGLLP
ncbi:MAG TPA: AAA family ATPase [Methylomirabilota bacterium]|jgi:general secretion pathway protein A